MSSGGGIIESKRGKEATVVGRRGIQDISSLSSLGKQMDMYEPCHTAYVIFMAVYL